MSLITRCPTCSSTFKVEPDQLRVSDGWVRCGHCSEIFDAPANMCEASEVDAASATGPSSLQPGERPEPAPETDQFPRIQGGAVIDAQWWQNQPSLDMPVPVPVPVPVPAANTVSRDESGDATSASIKAVTGALEPPVMTPMTFRATAEEGLPGVASRPNPVFMPGFQKTQPPNERAQSKPRNWWVVLAVVAFAVLMLQVVFAERDLIAARQPNLKSSLALMCRLAGCEVSEPRQIASITVDGASFSREAEGDGYRLYFSLRNSAAMALKMPAVELTLLDTQERPVLRRVLMPDDFGASASLPPHAERTASLLLMLSGAEVATLPAIAGYHVDPFYP